MRPFASIQTGNDSGADAEYAALPVRGRWSSPNIA